MRNPLLHGLGYRCGKRVLLDGDRVGLQVAAHSGSDVLRGRLSGGRDALDLLVQFGLLGLHAGDGFRGGLRQGVCAADALLHMSEARG